MADTETPTSETPLTAEHLQRIAEMIECAEAEAHHQHRGRRGSRQQPRRDLQQQVRYAAAALGEQLFQRDFSATSISELLHVNRRTLRHWQWLWHQSRTPALPLGRPLLRSPRPLRQEVLELLNTLGPGLSLPTLRESFPAMPRNELADLLARYRRVWRRRHQDTLYTLHWTRPGAVWAIDFSEAPTAIDGLYPYLLAVRDLASGQQLLWLPVQHQTAAEAAQALTGLFVLHGAPLILKSDNGSAFIAGAFQALIHQSEVIPLFSPPYWPRYNGAVEAGIGSLKERTERWASRAGHPSEWNWDDVAGARLEANATARPRGPDQPSPDERWHTRRLLTADERDVFRINVQRHRELLWQDVVGEPGSQEAAAMERKAIQRALAEGGLLLFRRKRITSPIPRPETANIP
jgi:transposase InsO family protein